MPSISDIVLAAIGILATLAIALLIAPTFVWVRRRMAPQANPELRTEGALDPKAIARELAGKGGGNPEEEAAAEAAATLRLLSGRTHRVLTAVHLHDGRRAHRALSVSHVHFAPLPVAAITAYVASGEPFGKAGAYAIQGALAAYVERIDGSHSGIMGLPLFETARLLRSARVPLVL